MIIGISSGKRSKGYVTAACLRSGSTGRSRPASRTTGAAQAPAAFTTSPAATSPEVRTVEILPDPSSSKSAHSTPCGALDVAAQDLHRPDKAVGRAEDTADEPVGTDRRVDLLYFRRRHFSRL